MIDEYYAALFILIGTYAIINQLFGPPIVLFSVILMQTFRIVQFVKMCEYMFVCVAL